MIAQVTRQKNFLILDMLLIEKIKLSSMDFIYCKEAEKYSEDIGFLHPNKSDLLPRPKGRGFP
jgi:hypothetical protein